MPQEFIAVTTECSDAPQPSGRRKFFGTQPRRGNVVKYGEMTLGQMEAVVNKLGGMDGVRGLLSGKLTLVRTKPEDGVYPVTVNYDQSLVDMIATGHYDWSNTDITAKNFPISGKGKADISIELIHFNQSMSSESVLTELDKRGLRPATLSELLAFGAAYSETQRQFPIVALDTVWRYFCARRVPCLWGDAGGRRLGLAWLEGDWRSSCRFAAVSK